MEDTGLSLADVAAVMGGNKDTGSFLGGSTGGILALIIVFILLFGGNGLVGGNNAATAAALSQSTLQDDLYFQTTDSAIRGLAQGQCNMADAVLQNRYESALQTTNAQFSVMQQMQTNEAARMQCCCETNRNIDSLKYENAQNTAAIINADTQNTQRILDAMCQNTIQDLRDKLQTAQLDANNASQTSALISTLRPFPQPAYVTCSPYTSANIYGCGA